MEDSEKIKKGKNVLRIKLKGKKYNESSFDLMKILLNGYTKRLFVKLESRSHI